MKLQIQTLIYFSLLLGPLTLNAQTVSDESALRAKISQVPPISFLDLDTLFSREPVYEMTCYPQISKNVALKEDDLPALDPVVNAPLPEKIAFKFRELGEGFDISLAHPRSFLSLNCVGESAGTCGQLNADAEFEFHSPTGNEDFAPTGTANEAWTFYVESPEVIFAERIIDATIKKRDWANRLMNTASGSRSDICRLKLISFSENL